MQQNLREISDPGWEAEGGFAYKPARSHLDVDARWGKVWNVSVHPAACDEENPEDTVLRIVAPVAYNDWVRMA